MTAGGCERGDEMCLWRAQGTLAKSHMDTNLPTGCTDAAGDSPCALPWSRPTLSISPFRQRFALLLLGLHTSYLHVPRAGPQAVKK